MSVKMILSGPWEVAVKEMGLEPTMELGPYETITYENGWWLGDGERIAEIFVETVNDMMTSFLGHPLAGMTVVPRTYGTDESADPEYPGKPYEHVEIVAA